MTGDWLIHSVSKKTASEISGLRVISTIPLLWGVALLSPFAALGGAIPSLERAVSLARVESSELGTQAAEITTPTTIPAAVVENDLGMRFIAVGEVYFSVWCTRVKDFEEFAREKELKSDAWRTPGFQQGPDHPVVNVTWNDAVAFCEWLTDRDRAMGVLKPTECYRLPTDREWSAAVGLPDEAGKTPEARDMATPGVFPWGTQWPPPPGAGNYTGEETGADVFLAGYDDQYSWTSPVGSFPENPHGLYDMGGNVWQWCLDSWNKDSGTKVLRGASWHKGALKFGLLSSCRIHALPDSSAEYYGFRVVRAEKGERQADRGSRRTR